jgi:hypothetical protein
MNGTSRVYLLNRLRREGHTDLADAVEAGKISAYAIAVELGWVTRHPIVGTGSSNQAKRRQHRIRAVLREARLAKLLVAEDHPSFSPEILSLFIELEGMSQGTKAFKEGSHRLAQLLDLVDEWWTCNHVHDRSAEPCHSPQYISHKHWHRCRAVRQQLLAATGACSASSGQRRGRNGRE